MITLRIDVDYAYPSRLKSFICTALQVKFGKEYLKNAKAVARMVNESQKDVHAVWFFTPTTIPDKEMLELLDNEKHEVGVHVVTDPYGELELLSEATGRNISYYTVHGTRRLLARLMWHRKLCEATVSIPNGYPLQSYYVHPTLSIDWVCCNNALNAEELIEKSLAKGDVLHFHPEWLYNKGKFNQRGPVHSTLIKILGLGGEKA